MIRNKIVIANWKMNLSVPESSVLLSKYLNEITPGYTEVVVCPSYPDIYSANEALKKSDIEVGAQNVYFEDSGAFTGEVSAYQLKGFASYCIVGHSERRHLFSETDKTVAKKAAACVRHGITPVICVGENLHERMDGLTNLVVAGQVEASLSELTGTEIASAVISYEPVWAIGTGHVCEPKKALEVIKKIRNLVQLLHGEGVADKVRIIYGGSVNAKNAKGFICHDEIDGFLVGGASLDHKEFAEIVATFEKHLAGGVTRDGAVKRQPKEKLIKTKNSKTKTKAQLKSKKSRSLKSSKGK